VETSLGGLKFAPTAWTVIRLAQGPDAAGCRDALNRLFQIYWRPVYGSLRWGWRCTREEAEDLTQEFFASFWEKDLLGEVRQGAGLFRSFLKATLKNFMLMNRRSERAEKRGGGRKPLPLDAAEIDAEAADGTPDEIFDRAWTASLFKEAARALEEAYSKVDRARGFALFRRYYLEIPITYEALSAETGASVSEIKNTLHQARQDFRRIVVDLLRDGVTDDAQLEEEIRAVFGGAP